MGKAIMILHTMFSVIRVTLQCCHIVVTMLPQCCSYNINIKSVLYLTVSAGCALSGFFLINQQPTVRLERGHRPGYLYIIRNNTDTQCLCVSLEKVLEKNIKTKSGKSFFKIIPLKGSKGIFEHFLCSPSHLVNVLPDVVVVELRGRVSLSQVGPRGGGLGLGVVGGDLATTANTWLSAITLFHVHVQILNYI